MTNFDYLLIILVIIIIAAGLVLNYSIDYNFKHNTNNADIEIDEFLEFAIDRSDENESLEQIADYAALLNFDSLINEIYSISDYKEEYIKVMKQKYLAMLLKDKQNKGEN